MLNFLRTLLCLHLQNQFKYLNTNVESEIKFIKTAESNPPMVEGMQFLGGFQIVMSKEKRFKLLFYDSDKF